MSNADAEIAAVIATHDRPQRLQRLLDALVAQTLDPKRFEVIIVDDASGSATEAVLEAFQPRFHFRVLRRDYAAGPATARDEGWRASSAPLVAFTDDDCEPTPGWLQRATETAAAQPGAFVQGRTEPIPRERPRIGPFTRTIDVRELDPNFHTCNIVYPRAMLERVGGFDVERFSTAPGGEDSDLAWRCTYDGARAHFDRDLLVHHAVNELGPVGSLRVAARWTTPMQTYVLHPELRRQVFTLGVFWKREHQQLTAALAGLAVSHRRPTTATVLAAPYLRSVWGRARTLGGGVKTAPFFVLRDLVETVAVARAAIRYRRPML